MTIFEKLKHGMLDDLNDEANTPDDAQSDAQSDALKGWIKLKTLGKAIYINASKIVALTYSADGAVTKVHTVGTEDNPWMVDESIDTVMEKIKNAWVG